ncbi:MAG: SDR family NAD(P)-dependent oxidoreductase [Actinomycetota bacterium]|nr:SDR family NAD(P)-dependent oxidoreductase [Actinomycetota bacterium]
MNNGMQGKEALVTGAGGFIGSHLTEVLVDAGARVRALVHYNSRNDWAQLQHLPPDVIGAIDVRSGDIRDPFYVNRLVEGIDVVFHLAALIPIPYSYVAPSEFVDTNVKGTLNVLEAVRSHETPRLIHTSTSETYGTAVYTPINELHPLQGQSPYSASKIGADKLAESYWRSFETPVVTVRPFNTYGPRQSARAFLPSVLVQALTGDVVRVGSLDPVRDMNYVADTARGFLRAAVVPGIEGNTYNLGSGRGVTMQELLDTALTVTGTNPVVEIEADRRRPEKSEVMELICDASKAAAELDWSSRVPLEDGISRTADWMRENLHEFKPSIYNV